MDQQLFQPFLTQEMFPHMSSTGNMSNQDSQAQPVTIKLEDVHQSRVTQSPSASSEFTRRASATPSTASNNSSDQKQHPKKRKSWGQVLPEPKTNLPPRKRAKTDDEKEQRRIERVKRNRLAAHNSRERKRQEVETLLDEKNDLEDTVHDLKQEMERMAQTIAAYKKAAPHVTIDVESSLFDFGAPATPESFTTINPRKASFNSPETSPSLGSIDSPMDTATQPSTPMMVPSLTEIDLTQHSAVMLCDLQCQSILSKRQAPTPNFMALIISLISFHLQLAMKTFLVTPSSITHRFPTRTSSWAQHHSSPTRRISRQTSSSPLAYLTNLVQSQLACSPNQAQQILLATIQASQPTGTSSSNVSQANGQVKASRLDRDVRRSLARLRKEVHKKSSSIGLQSWGQQGKPRKSLNHQRRAVCLVA